MIAEANLASPAMSASRIDMERRTHIVAIKLGVVVDAVSRRNSIVVVAQGNECAWCGTADIQVGTVLALFVLAGSFAEEIFVASSVPLALCHGNDRIEQYLEIGLCLSSAERCHGSGKMTSGRESHDSDIVTVDFP